jgi:hypothetical protein
MWDGATPATKSGLDFATLTYSSPYYHVELRRKNVKADYVGLDKDGARVHRVTLTYRVVVGVASG